MLLPSRTTTLALVATFVAHSLAIPLSSSQILSRSLSTKTIAQFNETRTCLENIAVRKNGDLLATMLYPNASLWTVRQPITAESELTLVHTFDNATGLTGITEGNVPDTFIIASGRYSDIGKQIAGTQAVWEIAFRTRDAPSVRKIVAIPDAGFLNSVASLPAPAQHAVLATDSAQGLIYRIDTRTGVYTVALNVSETQFLPMRGSSSGGLDSAFAANGIKVHQGHVYWSNSNRLAIFRVALDAQGYPASGAPVEQVATIPSASFVDDFTFDAQGGIWAATNFDNDIYTIDEHRTPKAETAVGGVGELTVPGDSSVAFGRTTADEHILYVSTFGGAAVPINGSIVVPGGIIAIDTRGYLY
ncbi:hypothetical protein HD806DRAFT_503668 [Xylariaceae sp. AK1471]|nr:hypothetical protein HD806DRAFT_503668 [Xylariaceae sp. AK1471]